MIRKHLPYASASAAGDYMQVLFEEEPDGEGMDYVLLQRQFEFPDGGHSYVESLDVALCGHYRVASLVLTRRTVRVEIPSSEWRGIEVTFDVSDGVYEEIAEALTKMYGRRLAITE
jgi:hypothetical protein